MNNIALAREAIRITAERRYQLDGTEILLPDADYAAVEVISPEKGAELLEAPLPPKPAHGGCVIRVTNEDSFEAAARLPDAAVMNFANAHKAGGGFLLGANAQEESLCRCSTLYASISSDAAAEMYRRNNLHPRPLESDYMLFSPQVCVFRSKSGDLLEAPFTVSVFTAAAPNRNGLAIAAPLSKIGEAMLRRIRIMLRVAALHGKRSLVLGAWGCGAFRNPPERVAGYFRTALIDEGMQAYFEQVCFAVYGRTDGKNYRAFAETFQN